MPSSTVDITWQDPGRGCRQSKAHDFAKKGILASEYVGKAGWMTAACICSPFCMYYMHAGYSTSMSRIALYIIGRPG
jgi:hypothetical protein